MIELTNEMIFHPEQVIDRLKNEVTELEAERDRLQAIYDRMSEPSPEPPPLTEQQAQEACMTELVQVADRHGYVIVAKLIHVPNTGIYLMTAADWGLQRKNV